MEEGERERERERDLRRGTDIGERGRENNRTRQIEGHYQIFEAGVPSSTPAHPNCKFGKCSGGTAKRPDSLAILALISRPLTLTRSARRRPFPPAKLPHSPRPKLRQIHLLRNYRRFFAPLSALSFPTSPRNRTFCFPSKR